MRRRQWFWGAFIGVSALGCLLIAGLVARDEVALDLHHNTTDAFVQHIHDGKANGVAEVTFTPVGSRHVTAPVQLALFGKNPAVGDRIAIEYDPSQPNRARRAGAHDLAPFLFLTVPVAAIVARQLIVAKPKRRRRKR